MTPEEKAEQREILEHLTRISNAAGTDDGTYLICWILERCGFLDPVFIGNSGIYKNATLSDFANEVFSEIVKANPVLGHKVLDHFINSYRGDEAEIRRELNGR